MCSDVMQYLSSGKYCSNKICITVILNRNYKIEVWRNHLDLDCIIHLTLWALSRFILFWYFCFTCYTYAISYQSFLKESLFFKFYVVIFHFKWHKMQNLKTRSDNAFKKLRMFQIHKKYEQFYSQQNLALKMFLPLIIGKMSCTWKRLYWLDPVED